MFAFSFVHGEDGTLIVYFICHFHQRQLTLVVGTRLLRYHYERHNPWDQYKLNSGAAQLLSSKTEINQFYTWLLMS